MASFKGVSRTNGITIVDMVGLQRALDGKAIEIIYSDDRNKSFFMPTADGGDWPYNVDSEEGQKLDFLFETDIMPFIKEGEVLVSLSVTYEYHRQIFGSAYAFVRNGEEVKTRCIDLLSIYELASEAFGIDELLIEKAEF